MGPFTHWNKPQTRNFTHSKEVVSTDATLQTTDPDGNTVPAGVYPNVKGEYNKDTGMWAAHAEAAREASASPAPPAPPAPPAAATTKAVKQEKKEKSTTPEVAKYVHTVHKPKPSSTKKPKPRQKQPQQKETK